MGLLFDEPVFRLVGDRGFLVEYGEAIAPEINRKVRAMALALEREQVPGVREIIPTYRSLLILYDPPAADPERLGPVLTGLEKDLDKIEIPPPGRVVIPVCYGGELGPDIEFVASHTGMSVEELIAAHSAPEYPIYMIGFTPGFPFLGGLPERLTTPRLETPRTKVPAGSVGIANNQTGMYPVDSPGGWQLIGRTPFKLFDPERAEPFLYRAGDLIKFEPITREEFDRLAGGAS